MVVCGTGSGALGRLGYAIASLEPPGLRIEETILIGGTLC